VLCVDNLKYCRYIRRRVLRILLQKLNKIKIKVNVNLSLCITRYHAMKTYLESGVIAPLILNLGTRWR